MACYLSGLAQSLIPLVFLECELFCRLLSLYDIFLLPRDPFSCCSCSHFHCSSAFLAILTPPTYRAQPGRSMTKKLCIRITVTFSPLLIIYIYRKRKPKQNMDFICGSKAASRLFFIINATHPLYFFPLLGVSCCTILSASQRIKRAKQIHEMASDWGYCLSMRILASASGSICLSPARSITTLSIIPPVNCAPALYSSLTGEAESRPISKPSSSE